MPKMFFIVGAPRSGSQVLLDFLTVPKNVAWIPEKLMNRPDKLSLASKANRLNWPLLGEFFLERRTAWKNVPAPAGGDAFWSHYLSSFTPPEDQPAIPGPEDVSPDEAERVRDAVKEICACQRRNTFVAEYSGIPRIRMMRSVFPEVKFIQVLRDPRSVAYHMVRKTEGGDHPLWREREKWTALMPEMLQQRLSELPSTPLNFCGILVRWYHELYKQELEELPETDRLEIAYSDLLSRPEVCLKKVMNFVDIPMDKRFKYFLKFHDIQNSNQRTNRNLNADEAEQLAMAVEKLPN